MSKSNRNRRNDRSNCPQRAKLRVTFARRTVRQSCAPDQLTSWQPIKQQANQLDSCAIILLTFKFTFSHYSLIIAICLSQNMFGLILLGQKLGDRDAQCTGKLSPVLVPSAAMNILPFDELSEEWRFIKPAA